MQSYENIPRNPEEIDIKSVIRTFGHVDQKLLSIRLAGQFPGIHAFLAQQLTIHKKALVKLPTWVDAGCLFTPRSFEQSSSERTALFKASLFSGKKLADLTGGLGVDDYAFAKPFQEVISTDTDEGLNRLVRNNFNKLSTANVMRMDEAAEDFLDRCISSGQRFDLVYADADRRPSKNKAVNLFDASPDIVHLLPKIFRVTDKLLLKLSPMIDPVHVRKHIPGLTDLYAVSTDFELKEILAVAEAHNSPGVTMHAVELRENGILHYSGKTDERNTPTFFSSEGKFLFEPCASLIKSGLANAYAGEHHFLPIGTNTFFYSGNEHGQLLMGREFRIIKIISFTRQNIEKYLKDSGLQAASITCRNFPLKPEELRKQFHLKESNTEFLFFGTGEKQTRLCFHCSKISR